MSKLLKMVHDFCAGLRAVSQFAPKEGNGVGGVEFKKLIYKPSLAAVSVSGQEMWNCL